MVCDDMFLCAKEYWWNFSNPCRIQSTSLYILLYCHSALDRLFLGKAVDQSIALSSVLSYPQLMLFLSCSNAVPRPTPDVSVFRYNGFLMSHYFKHMSSFTSDLALSYISCYSLFHIQAILTYISLLSGLHNSAVIGENLLR